MTHGEDSAVRNFLLNLEEHRKSCERQGKYVEAEVAKNRLDELKMHEENRQRETMRSRQIAERLGVEETHRLEFHHLNQNWDRKMDEYEGNAQKCVLKLREKHKSELLEFQHKQVEKQRKPKHSRDLLNLRRIEEHLARQKIYAEAHKIKLKSDALEAYELKNWRNIKQQETIQREGTFKQRQNQDMNVLQKRIQSGREEHKKQRQVDLERLLQRYQNVKAELHQQQTLERIRYEKFLQRGLVRIMYTIGRITPTSRITKPATYAPEAYDTVTNLIMLIRSVLRCGGAQRVFQRGSSRFLSSSAAPSTATSKGPPYARYFWYTTAIMLGLPGAIGGVFVYNLQTDDEFYNHFNDRYPDLIKAINEYVPLNEKLIELASREDIGPIGSTEDLINETMTVVVELQSRQKVKLEVSGSASQREIEALALKQSADPANDRVIAVTFAEEEEKDRVRSTPSAQEAWPPAPRVTWGSAAAAQKKNKKPADTAKEIRLEIEEIRAQQAALEASKFAGRDIDEADEKIAALEARKIELEKQLPRKRFLWIF